MDADADIEQLLASYRRMCAQAGIEPLPDDEAREQAMTLTKLLVPASRSRSDSIEWLLPRGRGRQDPTRAKKKATEEEAPQRRNRVGPRERFSRRGHLH